MSLVTLNGVGIISGRIIFPLRGRWYAELTAQGRDTAILNGPATLIVGSTPLVGTAKADASEGNLVTVTVVGGQDGLDDEVTPQHYVAATVRTILTETLGLGGETISPVSSADILDAFLPQSTRAKGIVADSLKRLVPADASWRFLPDGTVWIGKETWLPLTTSHVLESEEPTQERFTVALEGATVLPGFTFLGQKVSSVAYHLDETKLRAVVSYGRARAQEADDLGKIIDRQVGERLDFSTAYLCRVVGQNGDGSLELVSTDPRIPNMSRVPIRPGLPGLTGIKVLPGATMAIVEYENGDKNKPFVSDFSMGSVLSLAFTATTDVSITAPQVKCGGELSLAKAIELIAWASSVVSALGALGVPVSPLSPSVSTQVLKGS